MKTLKAVTVFIFTITLFFSCAQENINDYGTLVITLPGTSSARSVTAEVKEGFYDGFENGLTYTFECINEKGNTIVAGPYNVGTPYDVNIQLLPGNWDVWVKVNKNEREIGSEKYPPVTIKAGQTIILGGINVEIQGYSYGSAIAHKAPDNFDFDDIESWPNTPPININRFIKLNSLGYADPPIVDPSGTGAHGAAKVLWDNQNLYVLVLVEGNNPITTVGNQEHDSDSVEIFVYEGGTIARQYRKNYADQSTYGQVTRSNSSSTTWTVAEPAPPFPSTVDLVIKKPPTDNLPSDVSYAVIARIPFDAEKTTGDKIGVELQINGTPLMGNPPHRSTVAVWCSETSPYREPGRYENSLALVD